MPAAPTELLNIKLHRTALRAAAEFCVGLISFLYKHFSND